MITNSLFEKNRGRKITCKRGKRITEDYTLVMRFKRKCEELKDSTRRSIKRGSFNTTTSTTYRYRMILPNVIPIKCEEIKKQKLAIKRLIRNL